MPTPTLRSPLALVTCALLGASAVRAQTPLTTVRVADGLESPCWVGAPPGDDPRLFVLEQHASRVRVVEDGVLLPAPFLDLKEKTSVGGERGLLGMAFHPDYATNGFFFLVYTNEATPIGNTVLARYQVSATDPNAADPGSELVLLEVVQPFMTHQGGGLQFGPLDGYLYVGLGDGGAGFDPFCSAQNPGKFLGKLLRLDVDGGTPYAVPPDNPFVGGAGGHLPEIWSIGFRNPWRFSFDRLTGDLYLGDVGQNDFEEINYEPALAGGRNYGWRIMEGHQCNGVDVCLMGACDDPSYTQPLHVYPNSGTPECAVIGGFVYRGCAIPDLQGHYFFADYCGNRVWSFRVVAGLLTDFQERTFELAPGGGLQLNSIVSFGEDARGELYLVDQGGELFQIVPQGAVGADCDGDGQEDGCEIAGQASLDLDGDGVLDQCGGLAGDAAGVSIAAGGVQNLALDAGPAEGGRPYLILGSASGTSPGTPVDSLVLPLNLDPYTNFTLGNANSAVLPGSFGFLDPAGTAEASFQLPAGVLAPTAAGTQLHHAFLVVDVAVSFASNPLPVVLQP